MAMTDREENYETVELCLGCGREGCESCPCGVYTVRRKKFRLQPEPEKSPELAQTVATGERPLDKDCKCCGYSNRWELTEDGYHKESRYVDRSTGQILGIVRGNNYDSTEDWDASLKIPRNDPYIGAYTTEGMAKRAVENAVTKLRKKPGVQ
jgi:hypothetical protein